ncbi:MAG: NAD(P)/FAD-dependent oxidoreductase [Actinomycetota bacterium]
MSGATGGLRGPIVVAGGGPAGALMATYLGRAGHDVTLYESRPDLRTTDIDAGRSINLALATRGIVPLIDIGVIDRVDAITIPMRGRMVHAADDPSPELQPYGSKRHEVIHSVSRTDLNAILLDACEATGRVTVEFDKRITDVDLDACELRFDDGGTAPFGVVFGADGAGSPVRDAITTAGACEWETEWLDHDYKELTLPPDDDGGFRLDPNALHIWPRGEFMLIALANPEGDFTVTLFAPKATFAELTTSGAIEAFFEAEFPGFAALVPDLATQFTDNPTGPLGTLRARGWSFEDRAVLLGDAAHAIVPFHGQGMNAAMESARALDRHLRATPDDVAGAFARYETERAPSATAIADMALDNYIEMRSGVIDPDYLTKRALALELEQRHPDHLSPRYNMVMFSTMPYAEARQRARRQAEIIAAAVADPSVDVDALVGALPPLPPLDPLADPDALSIA